MHILDYEAKKSYTQEVFPAACQNSGALFLCCKPHDMQALRDIFALDESTVLECVNIDESVRFTAFDGYDFASLVHVETAGETVLLHEVNLYLSRRYLILVMPERPCPALLTLAEKLTEVAQRFLQEKYTQEAVAESFNQLLFLFFNMLIVHFSDTLEQLETQLQVLSESIAHRAQDAQFEEIRDLRNVAYSIKKVLRAFSYIGVQILCNENDILRKKKLFLFRNLDTRLRKLYDFSESVYGLSTELLHTYDSKVAQRTNEVVNKLTIVTLFFGPLTVITGIYGMNFRFMPELNSPWSYPLVLAAMLGISAGLFAFFKKKKWL